MTDLVKLVFRAQCTNGHSTQQVFVHGLLERLLATGEVRFHCDKCDARWQPTVEERVRLRAISKRARVPLGFDSTLQLTDGSKLS